MLVNCGGDVPTSSWTEKTSAIPDCCYFTHGLSNCSRQPSYRWPGEILHPERGG